MSEYCHWEKVNVQKPLGVRIVEHKFLKTTQLISLFCFKSSFITS